jgi:hypothetical protein
MACMCMSLIEFVITVGDEKGPCSRVYDGGYAGFSICQAISLLAFRATVLAMLIHKVEAPEGEGWSLRSLLGWFGGAARPVSQSDMRSMCGLLKRLVYFCGWPLLFSLEWWSLYTVRGVWLPSRLLFDGADRIHIHGP